MADIKILNNDIVSFEGTVGIGTGSPSNLLHIHASGNNASALIIEDDARRLQLGRDMIEARSADGSTVATLYIQPNGNTAFATTTGDVGIGTTSPSNKLEIVGSNALRIHDGTDQGSIFFRGDRDDVYIKESNYQLLFGAPSGMVFELDSNNNDGDIFNITHRGSSRFYVNGANGNVGIANSNPQFKLDVGDSINATNAYKINGLNVLFASATYMQLYNTEGAVGIYIGDSADRSNYYDNNYHYFRTAGGSSTLGVWNSTGLGIGVTNPTTKLWVEGSGSTLATFNSTGTNNWTIWRENGTVRGYIGVGDNGALFTGATTNSFSIRSEADLHLGGGGNNLQMTLNGSGVGIGTTSPSAPLHIYQSSTTGLKLSRLNHDSIDLSLEGANRFVISNVTDSIDLMSILYDSGNVGIGTTSPTRTLHVSGDIEGTIFRDGSYYLDPSSNSVLAGNLTVGTNLTVYGDTTLGNSQDDNTLIYGNLSGVLDNSGEGLSKIEGFIAEIGAENGENQFILPGSIQNELAGATERFTVAATLNGTAISLGSVVFKSTHHFQNISVSTNDTLVITITNASFNHSSGVGIAFSSRAWRARNITIETTTDGTNWTSRGSVTNYGYSSYYVTFNTGSTTTTGIRYTLTNFNTTSTRIAHLFANNYAGGEAYHVDKWYEDTKYNVLNIDSSGQTDNYYLRLQESGSDRFTVYENGNNVYFNGGPGNTVFRPRQNGGSGNFLINGSNVGIGTSNPTAFVQIARDETHTSGNITIGDSFLDLYNTWNSDTDEKGAILTFSDSYYDSNGQQRTTRAAIKGGTDTTGNSANGFLAFYTDSLAANSASEKMRINYQGNVGINTASPNTRLHVVENGGSAQLTLERTGSGAGKAVLAGAAEGLIIYDDAYGSKMYVGTSGTYNGRVGIGTITPSAKLEVNGTFKSAGIQDSANALAIFINGNEEVGIGTTSPTQKLDVAGTIRTEGNLFMAKGTDPRIYAGSGVGLNIDGELLYLNRYTSSNIAMVTGGGNVGIGTTSPVIKLDVNSSGSDSVARFTSTDSRARILIEDDTDISYFGTYIGTTFIGSDDTPSGNTLNVTSSGNVGIGTTNPVQPLQVDGNIYSNGGDIYVNGSKALIAVGDLVFKTYDTSYAERMRILANGQVGIGVTSVPTGYKMQVAGSILASGHTSKFTISNIDYYNRVGQYYGAMQLAVWSYDNSTSTQSNTGTIQLGSVGPTSYQNNVIVSNGNLTVNGNGSFTGDVVAYSSSDKRLKDNVKPIENALNKVIAIGGYEFDWNDNQDTYEGHDVGVIAQEVEEVLPEIVETRKDGYKAVKYEKMVPLLIEAIKDQSQIIDDLKKRITKLES